MTLKSHDIEEMAARYAAAWSAHDANAVADFYEPNGTIVINDGEPTVGREAITEVVQGFYDAFSDLVVRLDKIRTAGNSAVFLWTLEGTNDGPDGSGKFVRVSGWEAWQLSDDLLISHSDGRFDEVEYDRQLGDGV